MMVHPASHRISRVPHYSGYPRAVFRFRLQGYHLLWRCFPDNFAYVLADRYKGPTTPGYKYPGLGYFPFARHYLENLF